MITKNIQALMYLVAGSTLVIMSSVFGEQAGYVFSGAIPLNSPRSTDGPDAYRHQRTGGILHLNKAFHRVF